MFLILIDKIFPELSKHPQFYIQLVFKAPLCITLTISDQKIVSPVVGFDPRNMKKPPQKVAYLSRNSVVSEIFFFQPKWQISCSKMWPIEQLYIELGKHFKVCKHLESWTL